MIGKGSLVRYKGDDKRLYYDKMYFVKDRKEDKITIYDGMHQMHSNGKYPTITLPVNDFEEVR